MATDGRPQAAAESARAGPAVVLATLVMLVSCGCRPAAQVPAANLVYSAALRTAANTRSQDRLQAAAAVIERDRMAGQIGAEEYACYERIIATAEAGRWEEAERAAVRFRRDQLR